MVRDGSEGGSSNALLARRRAWWRRSVDGGSGSSGEIVVDGKLMAQRQARMTGTEGAWATLCEGRGNPSVLTS